MTGCIISIQRVSSKEITPISLVSLALDTPSNGLHSTLSLIFLAVIYQMTLHYPADSNILNFMGFLMGIFPQKASLTYVLPANGTVIP